MLARFTPICVGDDVDHIIQMLVQAWTTIGKDILTDDQVRQVIERFDNRYMEFCWHYDSYKNYWWIGKGLDAETANNVHTYRRGRDQDQQKHFPNEEWNAFISEGYRVIEESRQTRTAQFNAPAYGESMLERFKPRKRYDLNITLELETTDRPLDETTVTCLLKTLEAILQAKSLGKSGTLYKEGTTIAGNHRVTKHKLWIRIMEELSLGRAIMKQMLWWLRAPLSATISDDSRPDDPLQQLDNKNTDTLQEIYAGICQPTISRFNSGVTHTLSITSQSILQSAKVLGKEAHIASSPISGWLTLETNDGGNIEFCFTKFPEGVEVGEENTGVIVIRNPSPTATMVLHRFMTETGIVLLPMLLSAKLLSEDIVCRWSRFRVVGSEELHRILSAGAYEWWNEGAL
ncbi:uncharacterized protein B0J16DRAFT_346227 [Fusarium flagelliforme]|uniref:uncharacterized protein n=1 Tax=Fusarium flagelliforme TaxID=2675880 RepID=UPI001E8E3EA8|nr:uncharacterized protein B0J16DRAFT_346227 [Fusarium flagelliforme]KAH7179056.1 hypothetical protein B0J16DRAFT_346227 [Fusarium flagelliforme]